MATADSLCDQLTIWFEINGWRSHFTSQRRAAAAAMPEDWSEREDECEREPEWSSVAASRPQGVCRTVYSYFASLPHSSGRRSEFFGVRMRIHNSRFRLEVTTAFRVPTLRLTMSLGICDRVW
nr:hypothetical protein CFP56_02638 [Quercus suber]